MYPKKVWILTFICFIFIARKTIFNVAREVGDYSASLDSGTFFALLGMVCTVAFFLNHTNDCNAARRGMWSVLLYYIFAWSSFLWAGNFVTISFKAIESICNILLVGALVYNIKDHKKLIYFIILFATATTFMDLVGYYMRTGFRFYHTNTYSISAFIGMLLAVGAIKNKLFTLKELFIPLMLCIYAWVTGTSTASYISALIGGFVLWASSKRGVNIGYAICVSFICYVIWMFAEDAITTFVIAGHSKESITTATGRDYIWEMAFNKWRESPWVGNGYIVGEYFSGKLFYSTHNSFISALVNTGFWGFFIFVRFIYKWCATSFRFSRLNVYASVTFPVIIAICVNMNSFPVLASHWSFVTDSVLLVVAATFMSFRNADNGDNRTLKDLAKNIKR